MEIGNISTLEINKTNPIFIPIGSRRVAGSVCGLLGIGRTKLHELMKREDFPKPVKLGERCVRFARVDILAWAESLRTTSTEAK